MIFDRVRPAMLVSRSLQDFVAELPGLRDGDEHAIHQSRVAIRRVREAVALARAEYDEDELTAIEGRVVQMFRALGDARDADSAYRLVQYLESRFPLAAGTLGQLRTSAARSRLVSRQKVIKKLEALEMETLPEQFARARCRQQRLTLGGDSWQTLLRAHLARRAEDLRQSMHRAGGVYFRKRSHEARVAIKQLRYALALGNATGVQHPPRGLRTLRKAQDALGQAHDREVLLERTRQLQAESVSVNRSEVVVLEHFLQGEISALHEEYLAVRPQILDVCARCREPRRSRGVRVGAVAAVAVAIPLLYARHTSDL